MYVERAHQSVEVVVRTMKEVIERTAKTKLSATDSITTWMLRHAAFLRTRFSVGQDCKTPFKKRHHKEYTSQLLPFGSEKLMRKSETKRLNAANSILGSFQASGLEEPQRATSTSLEQHWVFSQQGRFEQRMIRKSGTVVSARA